MKALRIHPADNVAVALEPLAAGAVLRVGDLEIKLRTDIPAGHKFALEPLATGAEAIKYGAPIGRTTAPVEPGEHVHTHNLATRLRGEQSYRFRPDQDRVSPGTESGTPLTFPGFRRADGRAGVRNELWIVPTVACVNDLARRLAEEFNRRLPRGSVSGAFAWLHPYGCSQLGRDHENTAAILANLANHPNAGGVLAVGLGCENNTLESFRARLGERKRVRYLRAQDPGDEFARGLTLLEELASAAEQDRREPCPLSMLAVGLKCGGSDGFSGITANPLIGRVADRLTAAGASVLLTEVPEMFGAEESLLNRAANPEVFREGCAMLNDFKRYFLDHGEPVGENPSPGNKAGGITTLEDKSLGCVQKGGTSTIQGVLRYGERLATSGLNLLSGPGNDPVAVTALAAAGAQLVLFSTGRGTPYGGPVPTLKISTNPVLAAAKPHWIDFDAGRLLAANADADALAAELLALVLRTAAGEPARNERNGHREIAIFKDGVTL